MDLNGLSEEKQNGLLLKWGVNLNLVVAWEAEGCWLVSGTDGKSICW